jgi:SAM-dependent methyltransferase
MTDTPSICETGKDDYDWRRLFLDRTAETLRCEQTDNAPLGPLKDMKRAKRKWPYEALMTDAMWPTVLGLADVLMPLRRFRVLDIGCGYGRYAPVFSMFDCAQYVGIDATPGRIAYANERYAGARISFAEADARSFRADDKFDVVWCCTVIQHLPTGAKKAIIETIKEVLAPGGFAMLREGKVLTEGSADEAYRSPSCAPHMIPVEESVLRKWAHPCAITHERLWRCMRMPK